MPSEEPTNNSTKPTTRFQPGLPMVLSAVIPGLGQFYDGRRFAGCLWLFTTVIGYIPFIIPGIILHLLAITTAGFRSTTDDS